MGKSQRRRNDRENVEKALKRFFTNGLLGVIKLQSAIKFTF